MRRLERREDAPGGGEGDDHRMRGAAGRASERRERRALEAQLDVRRRGLRSVAARSEVLERMQPCRGLPEGQGKQCQEGDQRSAGRDQGSCLLLVCFLE